jgi:hypothetical protein
LGKGSGSPPALIGLSGGCERGCLMARGFAQTLAIHLTPADRAMLAAWIRHGTPAEARRARAIVLRASGATYATVQRETGLRLGTIFKWVHRYLDAGPAGLRSRRAPRRADPPRRIPPPPLRGRQRAGVRRALAKGMPLRDICRVWKVSRAQLVALRAAQP